MVEADKTIVIAGAGSIGCYAGGCLALAGRGVILLARPRIEAAVRQGGLRITDLEGRDRRIKPEALVVTTDPAVALPRADVILVTVKSGATEDMTALIKAHARPDAVVVSLQKTVSTMPTGCAPGLTAERCWPAWCRSMSCNRQTASCRCASTAPATAR